MSNHRVRRDWQSLKTEEKAHVIDVIKKMGLNKTGSRYQDIAGYHGIPKGYCHGDSNSFLAWHRIFMIEFENRMREIDPNITLPYIDWANDKSTTNNDIPREFHTTDLKSGLIDPLNKNSVRNKRPPLGLIELRKGLDDIFENVVKIDTMLDFSNHLNFGPHGKFHVWVGGNNRSTDYASYDPVFWFHHSNIDRIWTVWQKSQFGSKILQNDIKKGLGYLDLDFSKNGFNNYIYKQLLDNSALPNGVTVSYENEVSPYRKETSMLTFSARSLEIIKPPPTSFITIENLGHTINSFIISINAKIKERTYFVGSVTIFGYGDCCTSTTCKKLYKGSRELFNSQAPSFQREASDIDSITLQIDDVTDQKRISVSEFEKAFLSDEKKPVIISLKQVDGETFSFKHSQDGVFTKN